MPSKPTPSFFFYDLETSGLNAKKQRIMQFAGQRTDMDLKPIGEPVNVLVALSDEVLPDPGAIMVTGITPQKTREEGYSEADFCKLFLDQVCTPGTVVTGFNSVRFDDEFIRYTLYRNFRDPYEWCWMDGRSRWDMLDVARLTRALRPSGIEWPVVDGKPVNRLEPIAAANGLLHTKAHDALSDVEALIGLAKLIKEKQPKLFSYMLDMRDKNKVAKLASLEKPEPFIYASGRYEGDYQKTTLAFPLTRHPSKSGSVLVYDLRYDPTPYLGATAAQLSESLFGARDKENARLPVKELAYNKCPAVAPAGVLDDEAQKQVKIDLKAASKHAGLLRANPGFASAVAEAYAMRPEFERESDVDAQLYEGFFNEKDKSTMRAVRNADADKLADFHPQFVDERLNELLLRYKARNYPRALSSGEREQWEEYRTARIKRDLPGFVEQLQKIAALPQAHKKQFLLEELQLWAESIAPAE